MEDKIEQLRLSIVYLICVTINDVKEDIKELKSREKLNPKHKGYKGFECQIHKCT